MRHYKELTLDGQVYRISKFTPEVACFWATRLFGDMAGAVGPSGKIKQEDVPKFIAKFARMQRNDFALLQRDCLSFVVTKFNIAEFQPLVDEDGNYTLPDIAAPTVFALTIHAFMYSIADFFAEGEAMTSLVGLFGDTTAPPTNTSTNSSTSPFDLNTGDSESYGTAPMISPTSSPSLT